MRVAICDPSRESLELMENYLKESSYVSEIELFSEIKYLFDEMKKGLYYDLIFLEIDWHTKKIGIDYAKELQKIGPYTKIVYINECADEYIEEIFLNTSNLSGFILKPVSKEKLEKNVEKIKTQKMNTEDKLIFRYRGTILAIPFEDLICIESQLHQKGFLIFQKIWRK